MPSRAAKIEAARVLAAAGFTPASVSQSIRLGDISLLEHSGLYEKEVDGHIVDTDHEESA